MIISKKRHANLYRSISEPITSLRMKVDGLTLEELDARLAQLELDIHAGMVVALDLHKQAGVGR